MKIFKWKRVDTNLFLDKVPERRSEVVWKDVKEESGIVALNMNSGIFYVLKDKEAEVWKLCDGRKTCRQIVDAVKRVFPHSHEKEIIKFVSKLASDGLIYFIDK